MQNFIDKIKILKLFSELINFFPFYLLSLIKIIINNNK